MNNTRNGEDNQIEVRKSALTLERISMIQEISAPVSRTLHLIARFENYKTGHICDVGYEKLSELTGIPESTLRGHVRKLTKLNLLIKESPLWKGMHQNDRLAVNWARVIGLSQPVEKGILDYFIHRSQMSAGHRSQMSDTSISKLSHKKEEIDSVVSSGDSLRSPQSPGDSLPEETTKGKGKTSPVESDSIGGNEITYKSLSLVKVSEYDSRMDREPMLEDLEVWRDRVFDYWLDSVLALKDGNPIDWVTFAPFDKFERHTVKRMMRNFSNRVLEDYEFSPLQCMNFLLRSIRWGDIPKGGLLSYVSYSRACFKSVSVIFRPCVTYSQSAFA